MSDESSNGPSFAPIVGGILLALLIGAALGLIACISSWDVPVTIESGASKFLWRLWAGIWVGGAVALVIGGVMAWHGAVIGSLPSRSDHASFWGLFTGVVFGLSLGPLLGGLLGLSVGQSLLTGAVFGLWLGPLLGVIAWEIGFFGASGAR